MKITSLPDLCLLRICDHLHPCELLEIHQIHPRFSALQPSACARRRSLTLIINYNNSEKHNYDHLFEDRFYSFPYRKELLDENGNQIYSLDSSPPNFKKSVPHLHFPEITEQTVKYVTETFPNIAHLRLAIICDYYLTDTDNLITLLSKYAPKLISFNFQCYYKNDFYHWNDDDDQNDAQVEIAAPGVLLPRRGVAEVDEELEKKLRVSNQLFRLITCVNSMISLKFLTLDFQNYFNNGGKKYFQELSLPIISQLREFYFRSYDHPRLLLNSLKKYAESNRDLKHLGISNDVYRKHGRDYAREFTCLSQELCGKFTRLSPIHYPFDNQLIMSFDNLTSITLRQSRESRIQMTMSYLANGLVSLKQLIHLRLHRGNVLTEQPPLHEDDSVPKEDIPQLTSIKVLEISFSGTSHTDFESKHWGWVFPSLQVMQIDLFCGWSCTSCRYDRLSGVSLERQKKCIKKLVDPLWKYWFQDVKIYGFLPDVQEYWLVERPIVEKSKKWKWFLS